MNKSLILFLLLFVNSACKQVQQEKANIPEKTNLSFDYSTFNLKSGDILFQDSDCGPFCESIEKVTYGIQGSKFSHVGLVIQNLKKELVVLEAVTAGVIETPLDSFFIRSFDSDNKR